MPKRVVFFFFFFFFAHKRHLQTYFSFSIKGGLSTQDEMCLTFAYYYPRMAVAHCISEPALNTFNGHGFAVSLPVDMAQLFKASLA